MTVTLTVAGTQPETEYTLVVTGLKINAELQEDISKVFTTPDVSELYSPAISFKDDITQLKADGASSTLVTFSLNDAEGSVVTEAQDVEVAFSTTFGSLGEQRVSVQNGVATVMLTSEFLTVDRDAKVTGTVVNAADESLLGLEAEATILMTPNPDSGDNESVGASLTDAEANQADRVIAYFNKDVDVNDYLNEDGSGDIDATKAIVKVYEESTSAVLAKEVTVKGLMPVPGNTKALQIMLDVEANVTNALTDNSDVFVEFTDSTKTVPVARDASFKNTDVRKPSMLSVNKDGLNKIVVTFSESVISNNSANGALNKDNWTIDGVLLSNTTKFGNANITVGTFDKAEGTDTRNVVTIELGTGKYFAPGDHSIQAANIGDWAMLSDANNIMNTQTLDFNIPIDNDAPTATLEVQSPEQWVLTFDKDIVEDASTLSSKLKLQRYDVDNAQWIDDPDVDNIGVQNADTNLDLHVTLIDTHTFLIECDYDWTNVHSTSSSNKNYFNYDYRLNLAVDAVTNIANGKKNIEQNLELDGAMETPDTVSPEILMIEENTDIAGEYLVTMSEPVKLATANDEGATLAEGQAALPPVKAEFIKKDLSKTISGTVDNAFVDEYDTQLKVTPDETLDAGVWTLVVRSISDDIGNTAASATADFTVVDNTTPPTTSDFDILWSFADTDTDVDVTTETDDDGYDYVYVKFNKAVSTAGDFKNALKTSNYTLNAAPLPTGTQILADIAGYDDLDGVVDSITIRLPEDTLQGSNAPHNLNVSKYIESTTADETIGEHGGELTLTYDNNTWDTDMATDVANELSVRASLDLVKVELDKMDDGIDPTEIASFEAAYATAEGLIAGLPAESLVKAQYESELDSYLTAVKAHADFATYMVPGNFDVSIATAGNPNVGLVIDGAAEVTTFDATLLDGSNRYTISVTDDDSYGDAVTLTAATGAVTVTTEADPNAAAGATYVHTITITDEFWGVSDTVTVNVNDDAVAPLTDTLNVQAD